MPMMMATIAGLQVALSPNRSVNGGAGSLEQMEDIILNVLITPCTSFMQCILDIPPGRHPESSSISIPEIGPSNSTLVGTHYPFSAGTADI